MALTPKQQRFVQEYLVDLNATAAAIRAGYSKKNADKIGPSLLGKNSVSQEIQAAIQDRERRTHITQDRVVQELAKVAFANGTVYARVTGGGTKVELTDTDELTNDQKAAISCIKQSKFGIEVSTYDKIRALELLGKHLGIFDRSGPAGDPSAVNTFLQAVRPTKEEVEALYAEEDG